MNNSEQVKLTEQQIEEFSRKALMDEDLFCPYCESRVYEPDYEKCYECGNKNPLKKLGLV